MTLPETDQSRLANIRSQNLQWLAVEPDAQRWDTTFLLEVIDRLSEKSE